MSIEGLKKFVSDGSYANLKHGELKLKFLKNLIRDEQDRLNNKRMMWREHGVIGEFVTSKVYEYDRTELNVLLYDIGILPVISQISSNLLSEEELQILKPFQVLGKKYIRYVPNKLGKITGINQAIFFENIYEKTLADKVALWKNAFLEADFLRNTWESKRKLALKSCGSSSSIAFEMGSFSILETPACYTAEKAFKLLNKERFLMCADVDLQRLVEFTARGILRISEMNKIRKITDIQRKFFLITLEKEQRKRLYWHSKLERLSKLTM